jgi:hypothetical protein
VDFGAELVDLPASIEPLAAEAFVRELLRLTVHPFASVRALATRELAAVAPIALGCVVAAMRAHALTFEQQGPAVADAEALLLAPIAALPVQRPKHRKLRPAAAAAALARVPFRQNDLLLLVALASNHPHDGAVIDTLSTYVTAWAAASSDGLLAVPEGVPVTLGLLTAICRALMHVARARLVLSGREIVPDDLGAQPWSAAGVLLLRAVERTARRCKSVAEAKSLSAPHPQASFDNALLGALEPLLLLAAPGQTAPGDLAALVQLPLSRGPHALLGVSRCLAAALHAADPSDERAMFRFCSRASLPEFQSAVHLGTASFQKVRGTHEDVLDQLMASVCPPQPPLRSAEAPLPGSEQILAAPVPTLASHAYATAIAWAVVAAPSRWLSTAEAVGELLAVCLVHLVSPFPTLRQVAVDLLSRLLSAAEALPSLPIYSIALALPAVPLRSATEHEAALAQAGHFLERVGDADPSLVNPLLRGVLALFPDLAADTRVRLLSPLAPFLRAAVPLAQPGSPQTAVTIDLAMSLTRACQFAQPPIPLKAHIVPSGLDPATAEPLRRMWDALVHLPADAAVPMGAAPAAIVAHIHPLLGRALKLSRELEQSAPSSDEADEHEHEMDEEPSDFAPAASDLTSQAPPSAPPPPPRRLRADAVCRALRACVQFATQQHCAESVRYLVDSVRTGPEPRVEPGAADVAADADTDVATYPAAGGLFAPPSPTEEAAFVLIGDLAIRHGLLLADDLGIVLLNGLVFHRETLLPAFVANLCQAFSGALSVDVADLLGDDRQPLTRDALKQYVSGQASRVEPPIPSVASWAAAAAHSPAPDALFAMQAAQPADSFEVLQAMVLPPDTGSAGFGAGSAGLSSAAAAGAVASVGSLSPASAFRAGSGASAGDAYTVLEQADLRDIPPLLPLAAPLCPELAAVLAAHSLQWAAAVGAYSVGSALSGAACMPPSLEAVKLQHQCLSCFAAASPYAPFVFAPDVLTAARQGVAAAASDEADAWVVTQLATIIGSSLASLSSASAAHDRQVQAAILAVLRLAIRAASELVAPLAKSADAPGALAAFAALAAVLPQRPELSSAAAATVLLAPLVDLSPADAEAIVLPFCETVEISAQFPDHTELLLGERTALILLRCLAVQAPSTATPLPVALRVWRVVASALFARQMPMFAVVASAGIFMYAAAAVFFAGQPDAVREVVEEAALLIQAVPLLGPLEPAFYSPPLASGDVSGFLTAFASGLAHALAARERPAFVKAVLRVAADATMQLPGLAPAVLLTAQFLCEVGSVPCPQLLVSNIPLLCCIPRAATQRAASDLARVLSRGRSGASAHDLNFIAASIEATAYSAQLRRLPTVDTSLGPLDCALSLMETPLRAMCPIPGVGDAEAAAKAATAALNAQVLGLEPVEQGSEASVSEE